MSWVSRVAPPVVVHTEQFVLRAEESAAEADRADPGWWQVSSRRRPELVLGRCAVVTHKGDRQLTAEVDRVLIHDPPRRAELLRVLAQVATELTFEWWPGRALSAEALPGTSWWDAVQAAGLTPAPGRLGTDGELVQLQAPKVQIGPLVSRETTHEAILDLWCAVNDAGGAVGFEPGASRSDVAAVLQQHVEASDRGTQTMVRLTDSFSGTLLGLAWLRLEHSGVPSATALRVMVDPAAQGRHLGRLLMCALHAVARDRLGVQQVRLTYRDGTGLERFYRSLGYRQTARRVGALKFSFGVRDEVHLVRDLEPPLPAARP